jgi:hypothetical protein
MIDKAKKLDPCDILLNLAYSQPSGTIAYQILISTLCHIATSESRLVYLDTVHLTVATFWSIYEPESKLFYPPGA